MRRGFTLSVVAILGCLSSLASAAVISVTGADPWARGYAAYYIDSTLRPGDRLLFLQDAILPGPIGSEGVEYHVADGVTITGEDCDLFRTVANYSITGNGRLTTTGSGFVFFGAMDYPTIDVWCESVSSANPESQGVMDVDSGLITFHRGSIEGFVLNFGATIRMMPGVEFLPSQSWGTHPVSIVPEPSTILCASLPFLTLWRTSSRSGYGSRRCRARRLRASAASVRR